MKPLPRVIRFALRVLGTLAPPLAARVAEPLFWYLGKPAPVRAKDASVHDRARVDRLDIAGNSVAVYAWGNGPNPVLLVHGWRSRASRLARLVESLERSDRTILSFDAPGNGASTGSRTNLMEYAAVITRLGGRFGRFEAIVAHSGGVLASFVAARDGVAVGRLVAISGSYSWTHVFATFVRAAELPRRTAATVQRRILSSTFAHLRDAPRYFVAELDPTDTVTPLLVIHDELDQAVGIDEGRTIADAHNGPTELVVTHGLGHSRILDDPNVVARVRAFVSGEAFEREPAQQQRDGEPDEKVEHEESPPAAVL